MKLELSATLETDGVSRRTRFSAIAGFVTAAFVAVASIGGIFAPATYAREAPSWRAQAIGQDWVNLLVAVPWLVATAFLVLRGSRRARLLLGGALVYTAYTFAMYALDVHFNALFLIYCGALGLPAYALVALAPDLRRAHDWFDERVPRRFAGGFQMICAAAFALLWLSQIVPALLLGTTPADIEAEGLKTNPVHVLDLALVLPAMFIGGWLLWQRRSLGYAIVPVLLSFTVLMAIALTAMAIELVIEGLAANAMLVIGFAVFVTIAVIALVWMLHAMGRVPAARAVAYVRAHG